MLDRQIETSYFLCFTPRTGSTLLCECLARTGVAGQLGEHFSHGNSPKQPEGEPIADYEAHIRQTIQSTRSSNGVFGSKLSDVQDFARRIATIPEYAQSELVFSINALFPDPHFVWLTRRNKIRQAVSHWMAIQTGQWHSTEPPGSLQPEYHFEAIDHLVQEIVVREAAWEAFFSSANIQPHSVVYEDCISNLEDTVRSILAYCGIQEIPMLDFDTTHNQRLANNLSETWVQQYRNEKQETWWTQFW